MSALRVPRWCGAIHAVLCFLVLLCGSAAAAERIDISAVTQSLDLRDALTLVRDPTGEMSPVDAASGPGRPVSGPHSLYFGHTADILWLRLRVGNDSHERQTRWLALGHARLEFVDFYRLDARASAVEATWASGTARPLATRPIAGKESLFPVTLAPGEEAFLLLRVHGRPLIALEAALWEPIHYREHEAAEDLRLLVPGGAVLAVSIYLLLSALYRRDRPFTLLALWLCCAVLCELTLKGYFFRFLFPAGGEVVIRAPVLFLSLALALAAAFIHTFLSPEQPSLLTRVVRGLCLVGLAIALSTPFGEVEVLSIAFRICILVFCAIYPFLLALVWRHRQPNAAPFVIALSGLWATVLARMLVMLGVLPPADLSFDWLPMMYMLGLCCAATLGVVRHARTQHEIARRQQQALIETQHREQARLEAAIDDRTHALQRALIAADEANRAKSDFLARVSHDLRAPLTAILGYADLVIGSGAPMANNGRVIRRSAQHLLGLLNDLIDYARGSSLPNALQALPVYAPNLLKSIAAEGEALARRQGNRFDYEVSGTLPTVIEVDEKRLRQILINLLDNAAKFTRDGHIRFRVECHGDPAHDQALPVVFVVEDDGPGMDAAEIGHIFEPFRRLKATESHAGLGLGLAITRQWVDCMDGRIEADSAPGQGTRMRVTLALKPAPEDALSYHHQVCGEDNLPELDGGGRSVWVVEDSHEIRNLLCLELRSQGFVPQPIANGHDALTLLASPATRAPDLILTDLNMPFASGAELLAGVRAHWPGLPVVVITATPDALVAPLLGADPADPAPERFSAILAKPVSLLSLRHTLADLLGLAWVTPAATPDTVSLTTPDSGRLAEALLLIRMGAVSDLIDWADSLSAANAAWSDFAAHARQLAERGEMTRLQQLCEGSAP